MAGGAGRTGLANRFPVGGWLLGAGAGLALLLITGRWAAGWYADQLWAASVSSGVATALRRRALLGLGLDATAVVLGALWWSIHLLLALRTALRVPGDAPFGNPRFRRLIAVPDAHRWAMALGLSFGILSGSGASALVDPITLAWQGVVFGVADPVLGADAGRYVAQLPIWVLLHAVATSLVMGTLGAVAGFQLLSGSLRLSRGRAGINQDARRHLGGVLAALAVLMTLKFILLPYQTSGGLPSPVGPDLTQVYRSVGFLMVGVGLATTGLSLLWMVRPIHALATGGWVVLTAAFVLSTALLPDGAGWPLTDQDRALQQRFDAIAYGRPPVTAAPDNSPGTDSAVSLWDPSMLEVDASGVRGEVLPALGPGDLPARWMRITPLHGGGARRELIWADRVGSTGEPLAIPESVTDLPNGAVHPGATGIQLASGERGVKAGGLLRRVMLAWALQASELIGLDPATHVAWASDPAQRLARVLPSIRWTGLRAVSIESDWWWVMDGTVLAEAFPASTRMSWLGHTVGFARSGLVGVVSPAGTVGAYLRPEADSLSTAMHRVWPELIHQAQESPIPAGVLGYPSGSLRLQATLWARDTSWAMGRDPDEIHPTPIDSVAPSRAGEAVVVIEDSRVRRVFSLLEGVSDQGRLQLRITAGDSVGLDPPGVLTRRWLRLPLTQTLRDSVRARGDSFLGGRVRFGAGVDGLLAFQPFWRIPPQGPPALVAVGLGDGKRLGVGRTWEEAQARIRDGSALAIRVGPGESATMLEARRYLREADSALRRGDLTTFGRAFAALRRVLEEGTALPDSGP